MLKRNEEVKEKETTLTLQAKYHHSIIQYIYVHHNVLVFVCVHLSEFLPANSSTSLVIRGKRAFHRSQRTVSKTGNGTHTLHSKPEENSLWAALYYTHT